MVSNEWKGLVHLHFYAPYINMPQLGSTRCKHNIRWQHLSRMKNVAFALIKNFFAIDTHSRLSSVTSNAIYNWWSLIVLVLSLHILSKFPSFENRPELEFREKNETTRSDSRFRSLTDVIKSHVWAENFLAKSFAEGGGRNGGKLAFITGFNDKPGVAKGGGVGADCFPAKQQQKQNV